MHKPVPQWLAGTDAKEPFSLYEPPWSGSSECHVYHGDGDTPPDPTGPLRGPVSPRNEPRSGDSSRSERSPAISFSARRSSLRHVVSACVSKAQAFGPESWWLLVLAMESHNFEGHGLVRDGSAWTPSVLVGIWIESKRLPTWPMALPVWRIGRRACLTTRARSAGRGIGIQHGVQGGIEQ